ncbi:Cytoskeleton protein RodZ [Pseudomonas carbonaria]|uniref:Cytoskeleton protein RodZ n=2 Tax=Zestomonas carbonaria TaxID=2762745 RepID=A0A7U7ENB8_9GAMM|nr:Cytoskeleton protein RodZ [Pseudomonas carbonaria]
MKAAHPEDVVTARGNPGETLRKARENKGWSVAEVASQLNLTGQCLMQLEAGDFDKLPGHTFARGYVRTYAKLLGLDANTIVQEFDQFTGTDASGSSVHGLGRIEQPVRLSQNLLRMVSFALLVGLAGVGFLWWQGQSSERSDAQVGVNMEHVEVESADGTTQIHPLDEPEDQAVVEAREEADLPLTEVSPEVAAQPEPETPASGAQTEVPAATASSSVDAPAAPAGDAAPAPDTATAPAETAPAEQPAQQQAAATPPPTPAAGEGVVRLGFTADCWIQITDANGRVLVSGLKRSGDSVELAGKVPMEVRLGFARGAQLSYNGQAVDVTPFISGETARLKVGQ